MSEQRFIFDKQQIGRTIERLGLQIREAHADTEKFVMIGIQRRGVQLGQRIKDLWMQRSGKEIPYGKLDINLYRDDWTSLQNQPRINSTEIPFEVSGKNILLVDDVLYSGRTVRAALEAIIDFGRPNKVQLLVLLDRGNRELPIQADFIGKTIFTSPNEHVDVNLEELDGIDQVLLQENT